MNALELAAAAPAAYLVLKQLASKPLDQLGEILADRVRLWRFNNQLAILEQAGEYARKRGIKINPVRLKVLLPLLDGASLEEEKTIQQLWAQLMVNAGAVDVPDRTATLAIEFLKGISAQDAKLLDIMHAEVFASAANKEVPRSVTGGKPGVALFAHELGIDPHAFARRDRLIELTGFAEKEFELCFDNITRFNVIEAPTLHDLDGRPNRNDHYRFTRLGWEVMALIKDGHTTPASTGG